MSIDKPLMDITEQCITCQKMTKYENEKITLIEMRRHCSNCKKIHKADAIVTALKLKRNITNPYRGGRKSKIPDNVRRAIKEQHNAGATIRTIAKNTGYNKNTINKILKEDDTQM